MTTYEMMMTAMVITTRLMQNGIVDVDSVFRKC